MKRIISLFLFLLTSVTLWADIVAPPQNPFLNDDAHVLDKPTKVTLDKFITSHQSLLNVYMAVYTVDDLAGATAKEYAKNKNQELENSQINSNGGFVILLKPHSKKGAAQVAIVQSFADKRILPDTTIERIIDQHVTEWIKDEEHADYSTAITAGATQCMEVVQTNLEKYQSDNDTLPYTLCITAIVVVAAAAFFYFRKRSNRHKAKSQKR